MAAEPSESWISERDLIAATGANRYNLVRWRQQQLIPRPRRRFLGVGVGTTSEYPSFTVDMIQRLDALRGKSHNIDDWLWQLWLDGFPIDIDRWLGAKLDKLLKALARIEDQDAVEAEIHKIPKPERGSAAQLVQGRVRSKPARDSLMTWALSVAAGVTPAAQLGDVDPPILDILLKAAGISGLWSIPDRDLDPEDLTLSTLRNCIADATPAEIEQARLDWTVITELAESVETTDFTKLPISRFLLLLWRDFMLRTVILAFFILVRRSPDHSRNLSQILAAVYTLFNPSILALNDHEFSMPEVQ